LPDMSEGFGIEGCAGYLPHQADIFGYLNYWNGEVGERLELDAKRTRYSNWVAGPNSAVPTGIEPAVRNILAYYR
jgi:hypothetical protein